MRVLRYIVRFLGISFILLWILAVVVRADDDITVNFPQNMTVSGSVEITNLGINGDPYYDVTEYPEQTAADSTASFNGLESQVTTTYITGYTNINILGSSITSNDWNFMSIPGVTLKFPNIAFDQLKKDFFTLIFGTKLGNETFSSSSLLCGLYSGRTNLNNCQVRTIDTVITDQFGTGTWSISFPWRFLINPNNLWDYNGSQNNFDVRLALTTLLTVAAWFEVIYLVIGKVSRA